MNDQFAPSGLPRHERRRIESQLRKLFRSDNCSICGNPLKHNTSTASGLDARGNVVLAGECCTGKVAQFFGMGLYSELADTDKLADEMARCGGDIPIAPKLVLDDPPWKVDDRRWFEQNPNRSHRIRPPFPGEADQEILDTPSGYALMMLVRQVAPGSRMRAGVPINTDLLPLPDHEAAGHALWEMAAQREPVPRDREGLDALIAKYTVHRERGQ